MLAVAHLAGDAPGLVGEADLREQRLGSGDVARVVERALPEAERMTVMRLDREQRVLDHRQVGKDRGDLERAADAETGASMHRQRGDVTAAEVDPPESEQTSPVELAEQCRLPGAVGTDDGMDFAAAQVEVDVLRSRPGRRSA